MSRRREGGSVCPPSDLSLAFCPLVGFCYSLTAACDVKRKSGMVSVRPFCLWFSSSSSESDPEVRRTSSSSLPSSSAWGCRDRRNELDSAMRNEGEDPRHASYSTHILRVKVLHREGGLAWLSWFAERRQRGHTAFRCSHGSRHSVW